MQADINQTKSRSYNYFLRHFHLGLRILAVIFTTRIIDQYQGCPQTFSKYVLPLAIILTSVNLIFIIYFLCKQKFPRCQFFLFMSINIVLCSVIGLLTYSYFNDGQMCKKNMVLQSYIVLQILFNIPISLMALLAKFQWAQRYTNTPGNIIWTFIIISFAKNMQFIVQIQIVAWLNAIVSLSSFIINVIAYIQGITTIIKKVILLQWILALVLIVICTLITLLAFLNNYFSPIYANQILSNVALKFILVSIIDLGFWIWGLLTLTYENGDLIRKVMLYGNYSEHSNTTSIQHQNQLKQDDQKYKQWFAIKQQNK